MKKTLFVIAATAAIGMGPAFAQMGGLQASGDSKPAAERESKGIVGVVADQIRFSIATVAGQAGKPSKDHSKYKYSYTRKECEAVEEPAADDTKVAEGKTEKPVGPEPLYFGF